MATPLTSGAVALVRQYFRTVRGVKSPNSWGRRDMQMGNRVAQKLIPLIFMVTVAASATWAADQVVFASGENAASVIELFTSEGCSSCPPADAWMSQLKNNGELWKGIVPAVFHVDYWDGLGWPDRFAKAEFTQRQRSRELCPRPGHGWLHGSGD